MTGKGDHAMPLSPSLLALTLPEAPTAALGRMLAASLTLHLLFLLLLVGVRWTPKAEPLQTYEVSLVSLPAPVHEAAPPPPAPQSEPPPIRRPSAPVAGPVAKPPEFAATSEVAKPRKNRLREALMGIERPPEAPRLGDYRPAPLRNELEQALGKLQEVPVVPAPKVSEHRSREREPEPSLSETISKRLQEIRRSEPKIASVKPPAIQRPATAIQVPGVSSGFDRYLALVQSKISALWVAPPIDLTGRTYQVVIRFRLHRTGSISDVMVERPSGNGYYDDAGKRAVLSADPLPPFPREMTDAALDTHFSFTVGEETG